MKRPGTGPILAERLDDVSGRRALRDIAADIHVAVADVEGFKHDPERSDPGWGGTRISKIRCGRMRVVITGASGFLGRTALVHFRDHGIEVVGVQRQPVTGAGSICVQDYSESPGGDVLIHLAENGDRSKVAKLGDRFVTEVQERLRTLLDGRYQHVIYASSSLVYADVETRRAAWESRSIPRDFYAAGSSPARP